MQQVVEQKCTLHTLSVSIVGYIRILITQTTGTTFTFPPCLFSATAFRFLALEYDEA